MNDEEIGAALDLSPRTVQRDWLRALLGMQVAGALTAGALFEELAEQLQR